MALAPTDIKVAGHWKSVDQVSIKIGGHWKPVDQIMEKVAGHWKHVGGTLHPPLFTGAIGDLTAVVGEAFTKDVSHLFSTGAVPASYSLNNAPSGMVISNAGVISWPTPAKVPLNPELVPDGDFSAPIVFGVDFADPTGWKKDVVATPVSNAGGSMLVTDPPSNGWVRSPVIHGTAGTTYEFKGELLQNAWVLISSAPDDFNVDRIDIHNGTGYIVKTFTALTDDFYLYFYIGSHHIMEVDNISVREGSITTVTATNAGGFVVSDAFGVSAIALGPELSHGVDTIVPTWVDNGDDTYTVTSPIPAGNVDLTFSNIIYVPGHTYRFSFHAAGTTAPNLYVYHGTAAYMRPDKGEKAVEGLNVHDLVLTGHAQFAQFRCLTAYPCDVTLSNISIREILP